MKYKSKVVSLLLFLSWAYYTEAQVKNASETFHDMDTITDNRDGKIYKTIKIGDQWWMAENLAVTQINDTIKMNFVTENKKWSELVSPAYSWYSNDEETYKAYGALYNWYAVNTDCLCPTGWHVPTDTEWKELEMFLGLSQSEANQKGIRGNNVGGRLKDKGDTFWNSPNVGATNESGFTALPEGHRNWQSGGFIDIGLYGTWWSRTEADSLHAWRRTLHYNDANIRRFTSHKRDGFSVRCIKNQK